MRAGAGREQLIETDPARGAECRSDMTMRQAAQHRQSLLRVAQRFVAQHTAPPLDLGQRPMQEVGHGAAFDRAVLAITLAQQVGGR